MSTPQKVKVVANAGKRGIELRGDNRALLSAKEHIVILAGAADTGKSVACCVKAHLICLRCPGAQGAIVRKTKASLKETILNTFDRVVKSQGISKLGGNNPHSYVYPNGSKIWLGGMDKPDKVLSAERDFIQICQAEELTQNDIEIMATRCSGRASVIAVPQIFGDCNPGPRNHWIKQMEKAGTLKLLQATHKNNPTLYTTEGLMIDSDDVRRRMKVLDDLTGVRRLRLRDGIWATAEGAVYEMFNAQQTGQKSDHVQVRERGEMQRFYFALDDGFTNPAVILDIGCDSDGRWHIFREFYKRGWVQDEVARYAKEWNMEIAKINNRGVDLAAVDEAAPGLVEALRRQGINAVGGKGKIFDGIAKIQAKFKIQLDGRSRLTIDPECVETINELESYVWRPEKDIPMDANNHSAGALRYLSDALNEPSGAFSSTEGIRAGGKEDRQLFTVDDLSLSDLDLDVDLNS